MKEPAPWKEPEFPSLLQITLQTFYFTLDYFLNACLNRFTYKYEESLNALSWLPSF